MARIVGEVTISAPVQVVFDLVADERNEPRYNPRIVRADKVSDGPVGVGARYLVHPKNMGPRGQLAVTTVEYDRPHRLRNTITSSYLHVDGVLTFRQVPGGTRLRWDWQMRLVGPMRILSPLLALIGPSWERRNWVDLKHYMEANPT